MKNRLMIAGMASLALMGCNRQPYYAQQQYGGPQYAQQGGYQGGYQDQCMQSANPRQCMQVRDAGGSVSDYLMYGMAGYMLASYMTPYGPRYYMQTDPYYHGPVHVISSYGHSYAYVHNANYHSYSSIHHIDVAHSPMTRYSAQPSNSYANSPQRGNVPQGSPIQRDPNSQVRTIFRNNPAPAPSGYRSYSAPTPSYSAPSYSSSSSSSSSRSMFSSARKH